MIATLRQRNFALLWFGGLISLIGDWLLRIGLPVYVYTLTGSALATSIMFIVGFLPSFVLGSVAGVLVDRWDRRKTMIVSNLLLAVGLLPLLAVHSKETLWIVYIVQFFEACVSQLQLPAESALIPNLVSKEQLVSANALKTVSQSVSRFLGAALGGLLVGYLGLAGVTLLDVVSFLFVCVMLGLMRVSTQMPVIMKTEASTGILASWQNLVHDWVEGIQLIYRQRPVLLLFVMLAIQSVGEGIFTVLIVVFVEKVLGYGAAVYGSLSSLQALGSLIGGGLISLLGNRLSPVRMLGIGTFLFGFIDLLIINAPAFIPGLFIIMVLFVLVGIPGTGAIVGAYSLFQTLVEDKLRGRVFGAFMAVEALMNLIGMILAGTLGDRLGPVLMLNIQGSGYVLSSLLALLFLGSMLVRQQSRPATEVVS